MTEQNFTPNALAKKRDEASVIYSKFTLLIPKFGEDAIYCFVEGYDMPYYSSIVRNVCRKVPVEIKCNGKSSVIAANKFIETKEDCSRYSKRYFVDRDFENNDNLPNTIFITDGYAIENYYLSDKCVSSILETEFNISRTEYPDNYTKCMDLFHSEHEKFLEGISLFNAWYSCLYNNPGWDRSDVSLDGCFPKEWLSLKIGDIRYSYNLSDIEMKYNKAPHMEESLVNKEKTKLQTNGYMFYRGKYEMQFLFDFLRFIQNEPKKSRVYSVASCHIPFYQNTMLSTFSQYADVSDNLYRYIETGIRECMNKEI